MHEVQGVFCKTGKLWINRQIIERKKNVTWAESGWPNRTEGPEELLTHGLRPGSVVRRAGLELGQAGGRGWALGEVCAGPTGKQRGPPDLTEVVNAIAGSLQLVPTAGIEQELDADGGSEELAGST